MDDQAANYKVLLLAAAALLVLVVFATLSLGLIVIPTRFESLDGLRLEVLQPDEIEEPRTQTFTLADVDGDTVPDLIAINRLRDSVSVLVNQGDGTFADKSDFQLGFIPTAVAVADLSSPMDADEAGDADGIPDIIVVDEAGSVNLLLGLGDADFEMSDQNPQPGFLLVGVAVADFDGNARLDLALLDSSDAVYFLCNESGTLQACETASVETGGAEPIDIDVGDFDDDGNIDVVVLNGGSRNISPIFGNGAGTFEVGRLRPDSGIDNNEPQDLGVADVNDDGVDDIVITNFEAFDLFGAVVFFRPEFFESRNLAVCRAVGRSSDGDGRL